MLKKRTLKNEGKVKEKEDQIEQKVIDGLELDGLSGPCCGLSYENGKKAGVQEAQIEISRLVGELATKNREVASLKSSLEEFKNSNSKEPLIKSKQSCSNCKKII